NGIFRGLMAAAAAAKISVKAVLEAWGIVAAKMRGQARLAAREEVVERCRSLY
ncbi:hypothetical protein OC846_006900, partial [Tilletia horrida]